MKTSVEIDEKKVKQAKALSSETTLKKVIDRALDAFIARQRRLSMLGILGTPFFEGNLAKMRGRRGRSR